MAYKNEEGSEFIKENKLLLLCARTIMTDDIRAKIKSILEQEIDWDYLLRRSAEHKLSPLLYFHLSSICPNYVPFPIMMRLKTYYQENARKNMFFMSELLKILDLFEINGITSIPYKGPIMAINSYGNLALREFSDLDIFIKKEDVIKVRELLTTLGYYPNINLDSEREKLFISKMRDYIFFNKEKEITLEIHWRFPSIFFSLPKKVRMFEWYDIKITNLNNRAIRSPSSEEMILILSVHNAEHRWEFISQICDIAAFISSNEINWEKVIIKANKIGIKRILGVNLYLVSNLINFEVPKNIYNQLTSDKNVKIIAEKIKKDIILSNSPKSIKLTEEMSLSFKLRENKLLGIKDVISSILAPGILEWKNFPLPAKIFFLYPVLRPFLLLRRYKF